MYGYLVKKFILILVLGFFMITGCDQSNKISKIIESCSDATVKKDHQRQLDQYYFDNNYSSLKKKLSRNLIRHKTISDVLEKELKYLLSIEDNFYTIKKEKKLYSRYYNLEYMRIKMWTYYTAVAWAKYSESELEGKRLQSDFYKDFNATKKNLEGKIISNKGWAKGADNDLEKLKNKGKKLVNNDMEKFRDKMKKRQKKFLNSSLKTKLERNTYEKYFILCEKRRTESPIMFDKKWK